MGLVLSRKVNEVVTIGNDIEVMVVEIRGDKVKLRFHAPSHVPVHRGEVKESIERNGMRPNSFASVRAKIEAKGKLPVDTARQIVEFAVGTQGSEQ